MLGILYSRLQNTKDTVLGDPVKAGNFEACQQYLKTVLVTLRQHDRRKCIMSALDKSGGGGRNKTNVGSEGPPDLKDFKPYGGTLAPGIWVTLSYKQRGEVKAIRAEAKKKDAEKKRKISVASKEEDKESDSTSDDAGSQFGRNAHKKARKTEPFAVMHL